MPYRKTSFPQKYVHVFQAVRDCATFTTQTFGFLELSDLCWLFRQNRNVINVKNMGTCRNYLHFCAVVKVLRQCLWIVKQWSRGERRERSICRTRTSSTTSHANTHFSTIIIQAAPNTYNHIFWKLISYKTTLQRSYQRRAGAAEVHVFEETWRKQQTGRWELANLSIFGKVHTHKLLNHTCPSTLSQ